MEKETKKKTIWQKTKRLIGNVLAGTLAFHAGNQAVNATIDGYHLENPSTIRREFSEEFGFPIHGSYQDIEGEPAQVNKIRGALRKELSIGSPANISSLTIEPNNYFKKSLVQQVMALVGSGHGGYCIPPLWSSDSSSLVINSGSRMDVLIHEVKHAKAFEIIKHNPNFRKEWEALAQDKNGTSLYYNPVEQVLCRFAGLEKLVSSDKKNAQVNRELGFISGYARTNFHEDVAELCETIESNLSPGRVIDIHYHPKIKKRLDIAEKLGLVPEWSSKYIMNLYPLSKNVSGEFGSIDSMKSENYILASELFLERHPETKFSAPILSLRGRVLAGMAMRSKDIERKKEEVLKWMISSGDSLPFPDMHEITNLTDEEKAEYRAMAERDLKKSLTYSGQEFSVYCNSLYSLNEIASQNGDERAREIYAGAIDVMGGSEWPDNRNILNYLSKNGIELK